MRLMPEHGVTATLAHPNFAGRVWRTDYVHPADENSLAGSRFLYEPGARSFWHVHEQDQVTIAVAGVGLVGWDGLAAPHRVSDVDFRTPPHPAG